MFACVGRRASSSLFGRMVRRGCFPVRKFGGAAGLGIEEVLSHAQVADAFRKEGAIKSQRVYDSFVAVNPRLFSRFSSADSLYYGEGGTSVRETEDKEKDKDLNAVENSVWGMAATVYSLENLLPGLKPGGRALDIGSGMGYTAALLAHIMGEGGKVVCWEKDLSSLRKAREFMEHAFPALAKRIEWVEADAMKRELPPIDAPFSAIHVGAAVHSIPEEWVDLMEDGAVMTVPVFVEDGTVQALFACKKIGEGELDSNPIFEVNFAPMEEGEKGM